MQLLLRFICDGQVTEDLRGMAAILLRRLFSSEFMDFYPKVCISLIDDLHFIN